MYFKMMKGLKLVGGWVVVVCVVVCCCGRGCFWKYKGVGGVKGYDL